MKPIRHLLALALGLALLCVVASAQAADKKPNILIIWGDDIGYWNVSAYNQGMMGYKTPNIDRIAKEGALFTDWYGQQSCTAGRSCFHHRPVAASAPACSRSDCRARRKGLQARDVTHRRVAQGAGLHDGTVRQEPPRRPRRASAHGARLRRVHRLALSPERRGGAGEPGLLQGSGRCKRSMERAA